MPVKAAVHLLASTSALLAGSLLALGPSANAADGGTLDPVDISPADTSTRPTSLSLSADGRYLVFANLGDIYLTDNTTGTTVKVTRGFDGSPTDGDSMEPYLSANGKFIAFSSVATNLTTRRVSEHEWSVYRYNVTTGRNKLVSKSPSGALPTGNSGTAFLNASGRYVTYVSYADNIVSTDTNQRADVFRYDATLGKTMRVSKTLSGAEADGASTWPAVSPNGRYVAYTTTAGNMGPNDPQTSGDTYLYDVQTDSTVLASHNTAGIAVGNTYPNGVSDKGPIVAMTSTSPLLSPRDTDQQHDAFVYRAATDTVGLASPSALSAASRGISANGRHLIYDRLPTADRPRGVSILDRTANTNLDVSAPLSNTDTGVISSSGNAAAFVSWVPDEDNYEYEIYVWSRSVG